MNRYFHASAQTVKILRELTWRGMMAGNIRDWVQFFRLIEDGTAHQMIAENSKTYRA